jgi:type IV pilus assembly protein PilO
MGSRYADRLWMVGGFVVIALLAVVTWFLLVDPKSTEVADLADQTDIAQIQAATLRKNIVKLEKDQKNIVKLTATRDALQEALPADSGVPAFLRQLQTSGTDAGVDVSGITVGTPVQDEATPDVWAMQIQLSAEGTAGELDKFLNQLQGSNLKRAVLIEAANLEADDESDEQRLSLTVKAFVAPPVGAGAPKVTTD